MKDLYSGILDFLTDPLDLPIDPAYSWLIMAVIGIIAFRLSFYIVGELGARGTEGQFAHWIIRFILIVVLWGIVRGIIWTVRHWQIVLMAVGSIAGVIGACVSAIAVMRYIKKRKAVNGNA